MKNITMESMPHLKAVVITGEISLKESNDRITDTKCANDINIYVDFKMNKQFAGLFSSVENAHKYIDTELKELGVTGFVIPVNQ